MDDFIVLLDSLLYKSITVYISTYSDKSICFSGVLSKVSKDCITLILSITSKRYYRKPFINFNRSFHPSKFVIIPGQNAIIPIDKIDAIVIYPI